jgi:hypothetical protein
MRHPANDTITTNLPDQGRRSLHNFLRPCQLRFINDSSPKRMVEKSRQIGIFPTAAYDLVSEPPPARSSCNTWVSSSYGFQAQPLCQDRANWARLDHRARLFTFSSPPSPRGFGGTRGRAGLRASPIPFPGVPPSRPAQFLQLFRISVV